MNGKRVLKTKREKGGKRLEKKLAAPARRLALRKRAGMGRRRWRLQKKELWILILPTVAAVIAIAVLLKTERDVLRYTLEGSPRQYYVGNTYSLREGAELRRTADDKTVLFSDGVSSEISTLPVYYAQEGLATLPQDMAFYAPRSGIEAQLPHFTELRAGERGGVTAERDGKSVAISPGFAYDGQNLYLFLEPVTLRFNGYRIELPPLSFVDAMYYGDVVVFNYDTKEFLMEAAEGAVTAEPEDGDYTVSLLGDSMTGYDGRRTLLVTRPELLDTLF